MKTLFRAVRDFISGRRGQAIIEYVLILAVFGTAVLAGIPSFEDSVGNAAVRSENTVSPETPETPDGETPPWNYEVKYEANGGDPSTVPARQAKYPNVNLTLASGYPSWTGHVFVGWTTIPYENNANPTIEYYPESIYAENADLTLYACWRSEYTLYYHLNLRPGATGSFPYSYTNPFTEKKMHNVNAAITSVEPTSATYEFTGWSLNASGVQTPTYHANDIYDANADAHFYAQWDPIYYRVTYHANGGDGTAPATQEYRPGSTVTVANATLTKSGHQFVGWSIDSESVLVDVEYLVGSQFSMPQKNIDLYAVYMPTEYPYNGTDGTDGTIQRVTAPVDGTYKVQLWGAKGGSSNSDGETIESEHGGYTEVTVTLTRGQTIYFAVGGHGSNNNFADSTSEPSLNPGGWNGGGSGITDNAVEEEGNYSSELRDGGGGGGGAASAYTNVLGDGQLSNYSASKSTIIGVAGGSAGANVDAGSANAGYGGGTSGGGTLGGSQTGGHEFGVGQGN